MTTDTILNFVVASRSNTRDVKPKFYILKNILKPIKVVKDVVSKILHLTNDIYFGTCSVIVRSENVTIQHTKYLAEDTSFCGHGRVWRPFLTLYRDLES